MKIFVQRLLDKTNDNALYKNMREQASTTVDRMILRRQFTRRLAKRKIFALFLAGVLLYSVSPIPILGFYETMRVITGFQPSTDPDSEYLFIKHTPLYSAYSGLRKQDGKHKIAVTNDGYMMSKELRAAQYIDESAEDYLDSKGDLSKIVTSVRDRLSSSSKAELITENNENVLIYRDIEEGIDLAYLLTPEGVREELRFNSFDSKNPVNTLVFELDRKGVEFIEGSGTAWTSVNDRSEEVFRFAQPWLVDAKGRFDNDVELYVQTSSNIPYMAVKLPVSFLEDDATEFPVTLVSPIDVLNRKTLGELDVPEITETEELSGVELSEEGAKNVPEPAIEKAFSGFDSFFSDMTFDLMENDPSGAKSVISPEEIDKPVKVDRKRKFKQYIEQKYALPQTTVTARYEDKQSNANAQSLGDSTVVKQTYAIKNDSDIDKEYTLVSRFSADTDRVYWDGNEYSVTEQPLQFKAFEKEASVPEYAESIGKADLEDLDMFSNYMHTFMAGGSLVFYTDKGRAEYSWMDAVYEGYDDEVSVYLNDGKTIVELRIVHRVGAGEEVVIDPAFGFNSTNTNNAYNVRYDGDSLNAYLTYGGAIAIGDVNGDGLGDLILGTPYANNAYTDAGSAWVIFGSKTNGSKPLGTSTNYNIRYDGDSASAYLTRDAAIAIGDVNGDGLGDLALGTSSADNAFTDAGSVWVMLSTLIDDVGNTTGNNKPLVTSTNYNIRYDGDSASAMLTFGGALAIGDVNSDGLGDLVIGAYSADNAYTDAGSAWVMFSTLIDDVGTSTGNNKPLGTSTNYNIRYDGDSASAGLTSRGNIATGDINGDGLSDLVLGSVNADNAYSNAGSAWVMFSTLIDDVGSTTGNNKSLGTSTNYNIRYDGDSASANFSDAMLIGDVNGDGWGDLILGAYASDNAYLNSGSAWVMFSTLIDDVGTTTGNNKPLGTSTNYNIRYDGDSESANLTRTGNIAIGDVNGDGLGDLVLAAYSADNAYTDAGSAWVMFSTLVDDVGSSTGNNKPLGTGTNYNIRYDGDSAQAMLTLSGTIAIGDVNGDGLSDLVLGARNADNAYTDAGSAWVMHSTLIDDVGSSTGNNKPLGTSTNYSTRYDGDSLTSNLTQGGAIAIGDVNGDSRSDLVLGSPESDNVTSGDGSAWVMYAPPVRDPVENTTGTTRPLGSQFAYNARYDGDSANVYLGAIAIGDVNGDGLSDLVLEAAGADNAYTDAGSAYVIFGSKTNGNKPLATSTNYNIRYDGDSNGAYLTYGGAIAIGDVNGDGLGDLVLGARGADNAFTDAGSAWVMLSTLIDDVGATTGNNKPLGTSTNYNVRYDGDSASANLTSPLIVNGFRATIAIGDINGDGLGDLVLGSSRADNTFTDAGAAWVMFSTLIDDVGGTTGNNKPLGTSTNYNIRYDGDTGSAYLTMDGGDIAIGDVNGDGLGDLVLGAGTSNIGTGSAWVMFSTLIDDVGATTGNNKPLGTSTNYNIRYVGDATGVSLTRNGAIAIGDVNGDGLNDLVLGAIYADNAFSNAGSAWVMFSTLIDDVGATIGNLRSLGTSTNYNIRYDGDSTDAILTTDGAIAIGDVNGDGLGDLVLGTRGADNAFTDAGSAWVMLSTLIDDVGATTGNNKPLGTSTNYNVRYDGDSASVNLTRFGAITIGDVNGDGLGDLVLGARDADNASSDSGSAWVMFSTLIDDVGATTGNNKPLGTSTNYNIRYDGDSTTAYLTNVGAIAIGDVNGDGLGDLVLGASYSDNAYSNAGSAYIINGPIYNSASVIAYESNDATVSPSSPGTETAQAALSAFGDSDDSRITTNLSTTNPGYNSQVFKFNTNFDYTLYDSPRFKITWEGYGESGQTNYLYLWNFDTSSWDSLNSNTATTDTVLSGTLSGTDYVSNNIVWAYIKGSHTTGSGLTTDQIKLFIDETKLESNNSLATAYSFQKKTWYDGSRYWMSFLNNSQIEFYYSTTGDLGSWVQNTSATIAVNTNDFSIEADGTNAFIAYKDGDDISVRKASSYPGTGFGWGTAYTAHDATSPNSYRYPTIERDSSGYIFVNATLSAVTADQTVTYYWNSRTTDSWTDAANMVDGSTATSGYTSSDGATQRLTGNQNSTGADIGDITKIEVRAYNDTAGNETLNLIPIIGGSSTGSTYSEAFKTTFAWSSYFDITNTTNKPATWEWTNIRDLDIDVKAVKSGGMSRCDVAVVEMRVTYDANFNYIRSSRCGTANDPNCTWTGSDLSDPANLDANNYGTIASIGSGNMYAVWVKGSTIEGKKYTSGVGWDASATSIGTATSGITNSLSLASDSSGNVHLVFINDSGNTIYRRYTTSWQTAVTIDSSSGNTVPVVVIDPADSDKVYAMWIRTNALQYKTAASPYASGDWDTTSTTIYDQGTNTYPTAGSAGTACEGMVFVEWTNGAGSPYSIKFDVVASSSLAPNAPTNLFASETALTAQSGYSDPVSVGDSTPVFSSIYSHDTTDDVTSKYQLVVYSDEACTTPVWNSGDGGTTIANCTQGNRCADVELSGDPIPLDGSKYYFKMKYWDSNSCGGVFSDCTANFTMASPETQMRHGANFFNNEVKGGFGW